MIIKELIANLEEYSEDLEVCIESPGGELLFDICGIDILEEELVIITIIDKD